MYKLLFSLNVILLLSTKFVLAGQSVEYFSNKVQFKNSGWPIALQWLDSNLKSIDVNTPLYIQQNELADYYLHAYRIDNHDNSTIATAKLKIIEQDSFESKFDIDLSTTDCQFSNQYRLCNISLKDIGSPVENLARQLYYEATDAVSFPASSKDIFTFTKKPENVIENFGALNAIAVSDEPKQDNVPLKLKAKGTENLKQIHLEFEIENTDVADFEGKKIESCNINFTGTESLVCDKLIQVTPYAIGKTQINFIIDNSYWILKGSNEKNHYTSLDSIQINVGTLFAGYSRARIYRKGSKPYTIEAFNTSPVRSIAVDELSHSLYALLPEALYKQDNVAKNQLELNKKLYIIPGGSGQTLGLTDVANRVMIGSLDYSFYKVDKSSALNGKFGNMFGSIIASSIDKENNITYFADSNNGLGIYYSNFEQFGYDIFEGFQTRIDANVYSNMVIAADNNIVYAAVSRTAGAPTNEPFSKLFAWVNESMSEVKITGINPFAGISYITMLVFRHNRLYAGTNDGRLYYLNRESGIFKWQLIATTTGEIVDSAIDINGNIYLANKQNGVWKVPFNTNSNINTAYKINNYSQDENSLALTVNTIAIDNNI